MQEVFVTLLSLVLLVTTMEFFHDIRTAASLDIFDVHLVENLLDNNFFKKFNEENKDYIEEDIDVIEPDSCTAKYFINKIFGIMNIDDADMFTGSFRFKLSFVNKLIDESYMAREILDSIRANFLPALTKKKKLIANFVEILGWVSKADTAAVFSDAAGAAESRKDLAIGYQRVLRIFVPFFRQEA